ncbi:MAG: signal peptidase I [Gammaproteobacteria bacterium]|nr:signal peptidase I [Gammaproteobacteria bacterium]
MTTSVWPPAAAELLVKIRRFKRWLGLTLAIIASIWLISVACSPWIRLGINGTESLPGLFYLVWKNEVPETRGDLIAFYPPANRFYSSRMFFIKKAIGLPGDMVSRKGEDFYLNDDYIGTAKTHSHSGVLLKPGPTGVIPEGKYFVWTPHPDSYDSRYEDIGWISKESIIGRAVRLL